MNISQKIKDIRKSKGLTQRDLAKIMNTGQPNINYLESRDKELTINQIEQISEALGVSVKELLFDEKEEEQKNSDFVLLDLQRQNELLFLKLQVYEQKEESEKRQKYIIDTVVDSFSEYANIIVNANVQLNEEERERMKVVENN